ncbi:MAG: iron uptake porin [Kovacikia sp.]
MTTLAESEPGKSTNAEAGAFDQVTSVSQLADVKPTDWAFQALQSLVERYGCIVGYPDKTYRGHRALSRYEFAAGVNACLDRINELLAAATADLVKKEDLAILQKLQEEFAVELATLRGRVEALEARTTTLEKQQFSTTTKLNGEVVIAVAGVATGDNAFGGKTARNTVMGDRVRLNFDTSFTGQDLLRTRLQATNLDAFSGTSTFTPEGDLRFAGGAFGAGNSNSVGIDALLYQFPVGEKLTVTLEANAGAADDFTDTINPYLDGDGSSGALTQFGTRNAIYYLLNGAGLGLRYAFSNNLELSLGYLANDPANPANRSGLFSGPYGAIAQITFRPGDKFSIGLTYINAYNNDFTANGSTGSNRANLRAALANNGGFSTALGLADGLDLPTSSNAFGAQASFQITPSIVLNGAVGYTKTRTLSSLGGIIPRGDLDIWNWSVGLAFPDLFRKGSVGGIIVGMEPKVTGVSNNLRSVIDKDRSTSLHIEGFYQFQLSDNIGITPGLVWLTHPDHNDNNDSVLIGVIRTTFTF